MKQFVYNPTYFMTTLPKIDENPNLREPQKIAYGKAYEHFIVNHQPTDAIIVLPTGVGKTGLMGLLPYGICQGRALIITPQLVIKDSVIGSLNPEYPDNFWLAQKVFNHISNLPCLVEYEGNNTSDEVLALANIVVVNIQKLQARLTQSLIHRVPTDFFDMIIIDEAHHSTAPTWVEAIRYFSRAKVIKLTGTPYRSDGDEIIGDLVYKYKLSAAMAHGYVKSLENFTYIPDELYLTIDNDDKKLYTVNEILEMGLKDEDWISRSVAYSLDCSEKVVIKSLEKLREKLANDNPIPHKIIAVACNIPHAEQIKKLYEKYECQVTIIHSELERFQREAALSDIQNHRVQVVINVAMLGEGYDHPYLSVAAIFRPFRSLLPYAQFIGRVLRAIPNNEARRPDDNIAAVICHKNLNLDELWQYYKQEIQESETIRFLESVNLETEEHLLGSSRQIDKSIGTAKEKGSGLLITDVYLNTKLLEQRKKEEEEDIRKITQIQELLGVSAEHAKQMLLQAKNATSVIRRPDLYVKRKRKGIDALIKEDLVPSLLKEFNLNPSSYELKWCRIFRGSYSWIPNVRNVCRNNAAMLAIYITNVLNDRIGAKRDDWTLADWDMAEQKLSQIKEYLIQVLEEFVSTKQN